MYILASMKRLFKFCLNDTRLFSTHLFVCPMSYVRLSVRMNVQYGLYGLIFCKNWLSIPICTKTSCKGPFNTKFWCGVQYREHSNSFQLSKGYLIVEVIDYRVSCCLYLVNRFIFGILSLINVFRNDLHLSPTKTTIPRIMFTFILVFIGKQRSKLLKLRSTTFWGQKVKVMQFLSSKGISPHTCALSRVNMPTPWPLDTFPSLLSFMRLM